jgi:hypothetical protein
MRTEILPKALPLCDLHDAELPAGLLLQQTVS